MVRLGLVGPGKVGFGQARYATARLGVAQRGVNPAVLSHMSDTTTDEARSIAHPSRVFYRGTGLEN